MPITGGARPQGSKPSTAPAQPAGAGGAPWLSTNADSRLPLLPLSSPKMPWLTLCKPHATTATCCGSSMRRRRRPRGSSRGPCQRLTLRWRSGEPSTRRMPFSGQRSWRKPSKSQQGSRIGNRLLHPPAGATCEQISRVAAGLCRGTGHPVSLTLPRGSSETCSVSANASRLDTAKERVARWPRVGELGSLCPRLPTTSAAQGLPSISSTLGAHMGICASAKASAGAYTHPATCLMGL